MTNETRTTEVEAEYLATGVWEGAADQRRIERQYNAANRVRDCYCPNCHAETWNPLQGGFCTQCAYGTDEQLREKYGLSRAKDSSGNRNIVSDDRLDLSIQNLLLSQENERLRAENDRLSRAGCSGVLNDLLTPDENEALVAFVKALRRDMAAEKPR